jgi:hypothetical protein
MRELSGYSQQLVADITIHAGHPSEVMQPDRRAATVRLAEQLRASGHSVELEIVERDPSKYGLTQVEWTIITIAATKLFDEVFDATKGMLLARREAKKEAVGSAGRQLGCILYGPDGEILRQWDTRDEE